MKQKGVTLIEILVAVAIFSITIGAISGIFISSIRTQKRVLATQELLDQTSYVLEYMVRALRMAKKDDLGGVGCLSGDKVNYEVVPSENRIKFRNYKDECQDFYLDGNRLKEVKPGVENYLTSDKLQINFFEVSLSGENQPPADYLQPRVTIFLEISGRETGMGRPKIQIQTSLSQRDLDVQY